MILVLFTFISNSEIGDKQVNYFLIAYIFGLSIYKISMHFQSIFFFSNQKLILLKLWLVIL